MAQSKPTSCSDSVAVDASIEAFSATLRSGSSWFELLEEPGNVIVERLERAAIVDVMVADIERACVALMDPAMTFISVDLPAS